MSSQEQEVRNNSRQSYWVDNMSFKIIMRLCISLDRSYVKLVLATQPD